MADSPPVDDKTKDTVIQTNVNVLSEAPAVAINRLYQAVAQSIDVSMKNALSAQQHMTTFAQATTAKSVDLLERPTREEPSIGIEDLLSVPFIPITDEENN